MTSMSKCCLCGKVMTPTDAKMTHNKQGCHTSCKMAHVSARNVGMNNQEARSFVHVKSGNVRMDGLDRLPTPHPGPNPEVLKAMGGQPPTGTLGKQGDPQAIRPNPNPIPASHMISHEGISPDSEMEEGGK